MPDDLKPEAVADDLRKGCVRPVYLFYGPGEFRMERLLVRLREALVDASARDFNVQIFYGDEPECDAGVVLDAARSYPLLGDRRLVVVRRVDALSAKDLEDFLPYLENPVSSTCLIFISAKANFKMRFYKALQERGYAVEFAPLQDKEVIPWVRDLGRNLGLKLATEACAYLQQVVGNNLREIHAELEKLALYYGDKEGVIGAREVETLVVHSRAYHIFELMDSVSSRHRGRALTIVNRLLQEDRDAPFKIMGMLNRQFRLLRQAKDIAEEGGGSGQAARQLRLPPKIAGMVLKQSRLWKTEELETAFTLLYQADGLIKMSAPVRLVFENLIFSLCR